MRDEAGAHGWWPSNAVVWHQDTMECRTLFTLLSTPHHTRPAHQKTWTCCAPSFAAVGFQVDLVFVHGHSSVAMAENPWFWILDPPVSQGNLIWPAPLPTSRFQCSLAVAASATGLLRMGDCRVLGCTWIEHDQVGYASVFVPTEVLVLKHCDHGDL